MNSADMSLKLFRVLDIMHYEFPDLIKATYQSKSQRYIMDCHLEDHDLSAQAISTALFGMPEIDRIGTSIFLSKRESFHRIPYLAEWAQTSEHGLVFINIAKASALMLDLLIRDQDQDLHDLCSFKLDQLSPVFSQNDLRVELMTKRFQPHLVLIYPIFQHHEDNNFFFGRAGDSWMFDPLIDALSYRRSGHKATLVFYILHSQVEHVHLSGGALEGDTVKILKESIRSGLRIITPKIITTEPSKMELSFNDRFYLS
jgi:DNA-binding sugar fermentation-stimulating protein